MKASVPEGILLRTNLCWLCPGHWAAQGSASPSLQHPRALSEREELEEVGSVSGWVGMLLSLHPEHIREQDLGLSRTRCHFPREVPPAPGWSSNPWEAWGDCPHEGLAGHWGQPDSPGDKVCPAPACAAGTALGQEQGLTHL